MFRWSWTASCGDRINSWCGGRTGRAVNPSVRRDLAKTKIISVNDDDIWLGKIGSVVRSIFRIVRLTELTHFFHNFANIDTNFIVLRFLSGLTVVSLWFVNYIVHNGYTVSI